MLTIKHIIWDGDFETIYQAHEVRTKYRDRKASNEPRIIEFVAFDLPHREVWTLRFGKVYVMNEAGKTVSSYDLGHGVETPVKTTAHELPNSPAFPSAPDHAYRYSGAGHLHVGATTNPSPPAS